MFEDFYNERESHKLSGQSNDVSDSELPFDRVVFIDSTWRQTKRILSDPRVSCLKDRTIILSSHESLFWRHQRNTPRTYLSTIEAIYYFFVDLDRILDQKRNNRPKNCGQYDHKYDNLLFFFKHTYNKLREKYNIWWVLEITTDWDITEDNIPMGELWISSGSGLLPGYFVIS